MLINIHSLINRLLFIAVIWPIGINIHQDDYGCIPFTFANYLHSQRISTISGHQLLMLVKEEYPNFTEAMSDTSTILIKYHYINSIVYTQNYYQAESYLLTTGPVVMTSRYSTSMMNNLGYIGNDFIAIHAYLWFAQINDINYYQDSWSEHNFYLPRQQALIPNDDWYGLINK